jgi:hypothetical protein
MLDLLHVRYGAVRNGNGIRYVLAEHVKNAAGFNANRILDMMIQDLYPSTGCAIHGFEIKCSRADWLTELKDPTKAEAFRPYCDYFWLVVADKDIVKPGELPAGWGLLVPSTVAWLPLRAARSAPRNTLALPMPREMNAALMRAVHKTTLRQYQMTKNLELISNG